MSRKIEDLDPKLQEICKKHIENCKKRNVNILVYFTLRTHLEQDALYSQGRESYSEICKKRKLAGLPDITEQEAKKKVTNAKSGSSFHEYGKAYDAVPLLRDKKADWNKTEIDNWTIMFEEGRKLGLTLGHDFKNFKDDPHFQMSGITIEQLQKGV
jgi:peptidoglycan L-alanyl-D-glutamate endopeptidase CwlK